MQNNTETSGMRSVTPYTTMKFPLLITLIVPILAELIVDYNCMPNIACAILIGSVKDDGITGMTSLNGYPTIGSQLTIRNMTNNIDSSLGFPMIVNQTNLCTAPQNYGGGLLQPSQSSQSVFQYPPINTEETWIFNYNRCVSRSENLKFFGVMNKYFADNGLSVGSTFGIAVTNIPANGCMNPYI
jgi:hypothetical protein